LADPVINQGIVIHVAKIHAKSKLPTFAPLKTERLGRCFVGKRPLMEKVIQRDLGRIDYKQAWEYQTDLHQELIERKKLHPDHLRYHYLLMCEHPPVYTLGKSGKFDHLLLTEEELTKRGLQFYKINRGGDITFHGPGQVVVYPIFDLDGFFTDVHRYVRSLEEAVIRTLAHFGLEGLRVKEYTGVWLEATSVLPQRKICAIGVHLSRWVAMHGLAFNVNTDLNLFQNIVPCGIQESDKDVTSLARELGREVPLQEVKEQLAKHFQDIFEFEYMKEANIQEK
jgi:lipoyl(octanoyl) transferase